MSRPIQIGLAVANLNANSCHDSVGYPGSSPRGTIGLCQTPVEAAAVKQSPFEKAAGNRHANSCRDSVDFRDSSPFGRTVVVHRIVRTMLRQNLLVEIELAADAAGMIGFAVDFAVGCRTIGRSLSVENAAGYRCGIAKQRKKRQTTAGWSPISAHCHGLADSLDIERYDID